ncbi:MAG: TIGR00730 family Rossman fold protein [Actinomycetota bacterium]|nr:TIGR00730 family Rossman fold protein [Actinomycetota bacterium]
MESVCVFCGSSAGNVSAFGEAARGLGAEVARRKLRLVYGGGKVGLMGIVADAAIENGGEVVGVIPEALFGKEVGHEGLTELKVVGSMHERKKRMADLSDGFVALPGGFGTFEEFLEVLSWAQLSIHEKPCALLNVENFFDPLLDLFDGATSKGFVHPEHRSLVLSERTPEVLLDAMEKYRPPETQKWVFGTEL